MDILGRGGISQVFPPPLYESLLGRREGEKDREGQRKEKIMDSSENEIRGSYINFTYDSNLL